MGRGFQGNGRTPGAPEKVVWGHVEFRAEQRRNLNGRVAKGCFFQLRETEMRALKQVVKTGKQVWWPLGPGLGLGLCPESS